ncbi:VOC family protein [Haloferax sp. MBLA0076]|uniref:VOC family protein n=1 Tax=Haloferax litoreum TaxID=2666140 RepID=A0A6A8GJ14_9EURY|nr:MULTISPECIES: VOC family protein [Haloferax]KAB1193907.1 VOC family protein [Haloferax sp. CBA1148]MRX22452.1 VOC family protein [Haloferax litoreum]
MDRTIDHVAFGGMELYELRTAANEVGLTPTYGGEHNTGTTHMAVVPFPDGSYLELIAPTLGTDAEDSGFWPTHLAADAGPTAWCLEVPDVAASAKAAIDAGVPVDGPHEAARARPDGRLVEWDMCFEGDDLRLPFTIHDRTPRDYRVPRTSHNTAVRGLRTVVVATRDREATASLFARRHRYSSPVDINGPFTNFAVLPGTPLALCEPGDGELDARIDEVGEGPCAFLVGVTDLDRARQSLSLGPEIRFSDRRMAWFDHDLFDRRLGVVELP